MNVTAIIVSRAAEGNILPREEKVFRLLLSAHWLSPLVLVGPWVLNCKSSAAIEMMPMGWGCSRIELAEARKLPSLM